MANTTPFRAVSGAAAAVREEMADSNLGSRIYRPPVTLRRRKDTTSHGEQVIVPNNEALGVELHKDSK